MFFVTARQLCPLFPSLLAIQYSNQACDGRANIIKTSRPATFSAYGGQEARIIQEDLYMDGVSVQVIDTVLLPGEDRRPACLDGIPL